ncbi:hypothetical protein DMC30DRAFT_104311 [Rhodotorula diobovata]|uniref:Uncharacterized protein n=1 Tax=Rhodotorula diobovata TaxID=5288 RepID=A0A5C5FNP2_9BASI|nr:hypothetical protein DMC30DRAFT_104311 [Rhodotorula diobovata]
MTSTACVPQPRGALSRLVNVFRGPIAARTPMDRSDLVSLEKHWREVERGIGTTSGYSEKERITALEHAVPPLAACWVSVHAPGGATEAAVRALCDSRTTTPSAGSPSLARSSSTCAGGFDASPRRTSGWGCRWTGSGTATRVRRGRRGDRARVCCCHCCCVAKECICMARSGRTCRSRCTGFSRRLERMCCCLDGGPRSTAPRTTASHAPDTLIKNPGALLSLPESRTTRPPPRVE